jgi:uncharacterized membrane protein
MSLFDVAFYTHITSLCVAACGILAADHTGFSWLRGKVETVKAQTLNRLHWAVGVGLGLMLGSGSTLFWFGHEYYLATPAFYVKMTFVLMLLVNSFFIERLMHIATQVPFATLDAHAKRNLYLSGFISTLGWLGAFTTAFFLS